MVRVWPEFGLSLKAELRETRSLKRQMAACLRGVLSR